MFLFIIIKNLTASNILLLSLVYSSLYEEAGAQVFEVNTLNQLAHFVEIVLYCSENWNIGERQADKYFSKARTLIEQSVKKQVAYDYAKAVRRYEELYRLSIEKKDYKTALSVNKELTTLQGLFKIKVEHSGNIEFICNIPD